MTLPIYQVDAFTDRLFGGNPAAIIPLQEWLPDALMQQIALENNLSETVFFVPSANEEWDYDIRWFTPEEEINLCGHATLASAFVLFTQLGFSKEKLRFHSQSGLLTIHRAGSSFMMDFPSWKPGLTTSYPAKLSEALGDVAIRSIYKHREWIAVLEDEAAVAACQPNFLLMQSIPEMVIITAKGAEVDFVSRFFAPNSAINEDPVTGSAHSQLIPYWSEVLGKTELTARQLSRRGGVLQCRQLKDDRVEIGGKCVFYLKGEIYI